MSDEKLQRVRAICLSLPETSERPSHGAPTFFVRDKRAFVMFMDNHHEDGRLALWCAVPPGEQQALEAMAPEWFFVPPYVGYRGWIGVRLDRKIGWDEVTEIITDAYRTIAPSNLVAKLPNK